MSVTITVTATDAVGAVGSTTATVSSTTTNVGVTTILGGTDSGNVSLIVAQKVVLAAPGTIQSLSFYTGNAVGNIKLGLYNSANGVPSQKLAETASTAAISGWNTKPVLAPAALAAGTYWMVYEVSSNSLTYRDGAGGNFSIGSQVYGTMPATFPTVTQTGTSQWSFYMTIAS